MFVFLQNSYIFWATKQSPEKKFVMKNLSRGERGVPFDSNRELLIFQQTLARHQGRFGNCENQLPLTEITRSRQASTVNQTEKEKKSTSVEEKE